MIFSFQPVFWGTVAFGWAVACLRAHRGPLVMLVLAVTHARAALVCAWWIARKLPEMWRWNYPQAVEHIRRMA